MSDHKRRSKDKLPKDVSNLTTNEVMGKVFPKEVVEELKHVAHDRDSEPPKKKD